MKIPGRSAPTNSTATALDKDPAQGNSLLQAIYEQGLFSGRLDLQGRVEHLNRAWLEDCGFKLKDVIGKPFWQCGWWNRSLDVQTWARNAILQAVGGRAFRGQSRYSWADGSEHIIDLMCMPVKGADGRVLMVVPTGMDITGRIHAEKEQRVDEAERRTAEVRAELEAARSAFFGAIGPEHSLDQLHASLTAAQRLAAIVESSDDAIVSKDLRGYVTSWNRRAEMMFGYSAEEMIGRSITKIIPPELWVDEDRILSTIARGERIEHFETERLRKDGSRIDVSLTISPILDLKGTIVGAAKIARDITQRRKAERALRTTERLASVGRLAATVAHEINNPLEAVTNLIYLAQQTAERRDVRSYLDNAQQELERISHLTKQTLGFYRDTKGASTMRVGPLLQGLLSVFGSRVKNKGALMQVELQQDPEIIAVPGEIRQLLANLIGNSIDAVERGGTIRVRLSAVDERGGFRASGIRMTVADTGSGIPAAIRENLFEPFFTTKKEVGTGLGLWVCKNIAEKHHGNIRFHSSAVPGRSWTVFSVFLPQHSEEGESSELREAV